MGLLSPEGKFQHGFLTQNFVPSLKIVWVKGISSKRACVYAYVKFFFIYIILRFFIWILRRLSITLLS